MECGIPNLATTVKFTKAITIWIKNQATVFTNGRMDGYTKATSRTTIEMGMESSSMAKNVHTRGIGQMVSKFNKKTPNPIS